MSSGCLRPRPGLATRKTNGNDDRGVVLESPHYAEYLLLSTISIGQTGNNGCEYSRFEDDDHEWWRVVAVYNKLLLVKLSLATLAHNASNQIHRYTLHFSL
jgi:hypothetical protein